MSEKSSGSVKGTKIQRGGAMVAQPYAGAEVGSARPTACGSAQSIIQAVNILSNNAYALRTTLREIGVLEQAPAEALSAEKAAVPSVAILDAIKGPAYDVSRFAANFLSDAVHGEDADCDGEEDESEKTKADGAIFRTSFGHQVYNAVGTTTKVLASVRYLIGRVDNTFFGLNENEDLERLQNSAESVVSAVSVLIDNLHDTAHVVERLNTNLRTNVLGESH